MSSAKKSEWSSPMRPDCGGVGLAVGVGPAVVGFGPAGRVVWRRGLLGLVEVQGADSDSPEYQVGPEQLEITPPPEWIHSDIRKEVFRDPGLAGPLSLVDDNLTERIGKALARRPWVAKVERVAKRHPSRPIRPR